MIPETYAKYFVELLHQNPDDALVSLVLDLLGEISSIQGYAMLLSKELEQEEVKKLGNFENLREFTEQTLQNSRRAQIKLSELRTEVRRQLSEKDSGSGGDIRD